MGQIKDTVEQKYPILYDHIHRDVVNRWEHLNIPLHALAYVLTPKYYSPSCVTIDKMAAINKLVPDEEECALLRSELSKYLSEIGPFGTLHARKDRDRAPPIEWWNMYGSSCPCLHKLATKVLSKGGKQFLCRKVLEHL